MNVERTETLGLYVETDGSTQYATIYTVSENKPAGTVQRRRVLDKKSLPWTVYDMAGKHVCGVHTLRTGLVHLAQRIQRQNEEGIAWIDD